VKKQTKKLNKTNSELLRDFHSNSDSDMDEEGISFEYEANMENVDPNTSTNKHENLYSDKMTIENRQSN
jgi:hypothetical protein